MEQQVERKAGIQAIRLERFKSVRYSELELGPVNLVVGANGAGKSSLLAALGMLQATAQGRLYNYIRELGGPDEILHYGIEESEACSIKARFSSDLAYGLRLEYDASGFFIAPDGRLLQDWQFDPNHIISQRQAESRLSESTPPRDLVTLKSLLERIQAYHFHNTNPKAPIRMGGNSADNVELHPNGANLAAFLRKMKDSEPNEYNELVRTLRYVFPQFDDFVLLSNKEVVNEGFSEIIQLRWREKGRRKVFSPLSFSDGTLRFIALLTALLQRNKPEIFVLDEPEMGLHPFAIHILAEVIESAALHSQVVIATQSVTLMNQFGPESFITVNRASDGSSVFERVDDEAKLSELGKWLEDFAMGDLVEKNIVEARP